MTLLLADLNTDILLEILSYLYEHDALRLAVTARYFYQHAIHRVSAIVACFYFPELLRWHTYLCISSPARAADVRGLVIGHGVYHQFSTRVQVPYADEVERFVADVLARTLNARHVHIGALAPHPHELSALPTLAHLTTLQLWDVSAHACAHLEALPPRVTHLRLQFSPHEPPSLAQVAHILQRCGALHAVHLDDLRPPAARAPKHLRPAPRLASVRRLCLTGYTERALALVALFPALHALTLLPGPAPAPVRQWEGEAEPPPPPPIGPADCAAPLRRLNWPAGQPPPPLARALLPAHHLHLFGAACDGNAGASFDAVCAADPVVLSASAAADASFGGALWEFVAGAAPRLRALDLALDKRVRGGHELAVWVDQLPGMLAQMQQLVCVRVVVPFVNWAQVYGAQDAGAYAPSAELLRRLPGKLADTLHLLRYVALAVGPYREEYEAEERCDAYIASYTWWRVVEGKKDRRLVEIPEAERWAVRKFLLESQVEEIDGDSSG